MRCFLARLWVTNLSIAAVLCFPAPSSGVGHGPQFTTPFGWTSGGASGLVATTGHDPVSHASAMAAGSAISGLGGNVFLGGGVDAAVLHAPRPLPVSSPAHLAAISATRSRPLGGEGTSNGETDTTAPPAFIPTAASIVPESWRIAPSPTRSTVSKTPLDVAGAAMTCDSAVDPFRTAIDSPSALLPSISTFAAIHREATPGLVILDPHPWVTPQLPPTPPPSRASLRPAATVQTDDREESSVTLVLGLALAVLVISHTAIGAVGSRRNT